MDNDNNIQDVDFEAVDESKKKIQGKILYYSTSQVSSLLGETDSKIRYYTSVFDDILQIKISNKQRRYTEQDIEKIKFLIELKNEGMTIKQIQEYCQEVDFDTENGIQIKETNPLSIQTLARALMEEQHKQMLEFKQEVISTLSIQLENQIKAIQLHQENLKNELMEQVSVTVDEVVSDRLTELKTNQKELLHQNNVELKEFVATTMQNEIKENVETQLNDLKSSILTQQEQQEQQAKQRDNEILNSLRQHMEERKKEYEGAKQQENKSFWQKLFGK